MDDLQIQNMALEHLSVDPIADIDEGSRQSDTLKRFYNTIVEAALTRTQWKFARTTSATLAQDPADSDDGYTRWRLPSQRLFVRGLRNQNGEELDYRIEGDLAIVLNPGEPTAVYCTYLINQSSGNWPAYFAIAVSYDLAVVCCIPLTEDGTLLKTLEALAERKWSLAMGADAQQAETEQIMMESEASMLNGR